MSLSVTIDAMVAAGCSAEQLAAVVRAHVAEAAAQGPRVIPAALRSAVLERDNYRCTYCGAVDVPLHCDHVQAYSQGGKTALENLAAACKPCNSSKKDRSLGEWLR